METWEGQHRLSSRTASFVLVSCTGAGGPSISRRTLLRAASLLPTEIRARYFASEIRSKCRPYLAARGAACRGLYMWRGGDPSGISAPAFDLLDLSVYGDAGARYFCELEALSVPIGVRPSISHIATGSSTDACAWGEPVSVWPIGTFTFMYWKHQQLIYDESQDSDGLMPSISDHLKEVCVVNASLADALQRGAEVMFEMAPEGFIAVEESLTTRVGLLLENE